MKRKLVKSNTNTVISGTLGGIAEYLRIDPTIVRVLYVLTVFFSLSATILIYFLLALVIPSAPRSNNYQNGGFDSSFDSFTGKAADQGKRPRKEAEKVDDEWSDF